MQCGASTSFWSCIEAAGRISRCLEPGCLYLSMQSFRAYADTHCRCGAISRCHQGTDRFRPVPDLLREFAGWSPACQGHSAALTTPLQAWSACCAVLCTQPLHSALEAWPLCPQCCWLLSSLPGIWVDLHMCCPANTPCSAPKALGSIAVLQPMRHLPRID